MPFVKHCSPPDYRRALCALLALVLLCGCDAFMRNSLRNASPETAVDVIGKHLDYYSQHLPMGMAREEALRLLPKPHNTNTENVCVWIIGYSDLPKTQGRLDWQWLHIAKAGYFLVFVDGRLATPLCSNAAFDPWQALNDYAKLTGEQAEHIL